MRIFFKMKSEVVSSWKGYQCMIYRRDQVRYSWWRQLSRYLPFSVVCVIASFISCFFGDPTHNQKVSWHFNESQHCMHLHGLYRFVCCIVDQETQKQQSACQYSNRYHLKWCKTSGFSQLTTGWLQLAQYTVPATILFPGHQQHESAYQPLREITV
jgi:hypothetical protein